MHLSYKTAKYKDTIYKSYFLAESYREGGKVKKRNLWPIGRLTDKQIEQISMICKTLTDPDHVVTIKRPLSHCGHSKDGKPHNEQVLLAIMVNDRGYLTLTPFQHNMSDRMLNLPS